MTTRPIVAIVCDAIHPFSYGGRELRYKELLPRLADRAEVHVYTMHWWNGSRRLVQDDVTHHAIAKLRPMYNDDRRSLKHSLFFAVASLRLLFRNFDVLEADHIPYLHIFALRVVAWVKRKPLIATWHEVWSKSYWCEYLGAAGRVAWLIELAAVRLPDELIAASQQTADRLRGIRGSDEGITVIPSGVDIQSIDEIARDERSYDLVTVGRLIEHKRVDVILELVAVLRQRGIPVTCCIIGDGPERTRLQDRASVLDVADAVTFRYDVGSQEEIYALLKAAKIFISLSTREGFGIAVLEAIACGTRVITTSAPDNLSRNLVERYSRGVVCKPGFDDVAAAVTQMLETTAAEEAVRPPEDFWIHEYDWAELADKVMTVYTGAIRS